MHSSYIDRDSTLVWPSDKRKSRTQADLLRNRLMRRG